MISHGPLLCAFCLCFHFNSNASVKEQCKQDYLDNSLHVGYAFSSDRPMHGINKKCGVLIVTVLLVLSLISVSM